MCGYVICQLNQSCFSEMAFIYSFFFYKSRLKWLKHLFIEIYFQRPLSQNPWINKTKIWGWDSMSASCPGFFSKGLITASLKQISKILHNSDKLNKYGIHTPNVGHSSFKIQVVLPAVSTNNLCERNLVKEF